MCVSPLLALGLSVLGLLGCDQADSGSTDGKSSGANAQPDKPQVPVGEQIREAKGVELEGLSASQQDTYFTMINVEPSACDKPHSLATSLRDDPECRNSMLVAQFIADRLASGATPSDIKLDIDAVGQRPDPPRDPDSRVGRPTATTTPR